MRVSQGGHSVPDGTVFARFERTQANLKLAMGRLPYFIVYSYDDHAYPYELVELVENDLSVSSFLTE